MSDILKSTGVDMPISSQVLFTAPVATTVIILSGKVYNGSGGSIDLSLSINKSAGGIVTILSGSSLAAGDTYTFPAKTVLEPEDELVGLSTVAGASLSMNYVEHGDVVVDVSEAYNSAIASASSASDASISASAALASEGAAGTSATEAAASAITAATNATAYTKTESDALLAIVRTTEDIYLLTGVALDPDNGTIQTKTLTGDVAFTDSLGEGQSMSLVLTDAVGYLVTWPTMTWFSSSGNTPPEALTALDLIVFWKIGTTLYGKYAGSGVSA